MKFVQSDGGRHKAGYRGQTGDCFCRAAAIASGVPYEKVYTIINTVAYRERTGKRKKTKSNARTGVHRYTERAVMQILGFEWVPTMKVGQGCKVHLRDGELPMGRLVVILSRHATAVIDGVIYDTYNPDREGTRCVYGYYIHKEDIQDT